MSRKVHKLDHALTASMGYADKRSYRTIHGKEFLFGEDKTRRRAEIFERDKFRCVFCGTYVGWEYGQWHHVPALSRGGHDGLEVGFTACSSCHAKEHNREPKWSRAVAEAR